MLFEMGLSKAFRAIWHSTPLETAKGALKGQLIRFTDQGRYDALKRIRPNRSALASHNRDATSLVKAACANDGIKIVKIFSRVKTLGSLDRKARYVAKMFPASAKASLREDLLAVTVVVKSEKDCYAVLDAVEKVAQFPKLSYSKNPVDFMKSGKETLSMPLGSARGAIVGSVKIAGIPELVHIRIFTKETLRAINQIRGKRNKEIWRRIKGQ
jgi:hypothetical protein